MAKVRNFVVDAFCLRQFGSAGKAPHILMDPKAFEDKVNELYDSGEYPLKPGYAEFCKHLFVPNFAKMQYNYAQITEENKSLLQSGYAARTEKELPVLLRWFPKEKVPMSEATHLDVILYSREQIIKENKAMGNEAISEETAPWGIISVKPQNVGYELPMQPITMMRNAVGADQGGSGVPLDRTAYDESVAFWSKHATIE
eukprot:m.340326 g.340326  ORF g.340326 m.340326 type:complete len:200 (+) comp19239_c0_seq1:173-772(+)